MTVIEQMQKQLIAHLETIKRHDDQKIRLLEEMIAQQWQIIELQNKVHSVVHHPN